MRRAKRTVSLSAVTWAVLGIGGGILFWARKMSEPARPIPVSSLSPFRFRSPLHYQWISSDEILTYRQNPSGEFQGLRQKILPDGDSLSAMPVKGLVLSGHDWIEGVSPDGKWLLCGVGVLKNGHKMKTFALDGSGRSATFITGGLTLHWMPDSAHIVTTHWNRAPEATLYRASDGAEQKITLSGMKQAPWIMGFTAHGRAIGCYEAQHEYLTRPVQQLTEFDIHAPQSPPRPFAIQSPFYGSQAMVSVVPSRDRLFWQAWDNGKSSWIQAWMGRINPMFQPKPGSTVIYWTSKLDGSDMKPIASYVLDRSYLKQLPAAFSKSRAHYPVIEWSPDGKRFSFVDNSTLYIVLVE